MVRSWAGLFPSWATVLRAPSHPTHLASVSGETFRMTWKPKSFFAAEKEKGLGVVFNGLTRENNNANNDSRPLVCSIQPPGIMVAAS